MFIPLDSAPLTSVSTPRLRRIQKNSELPIIQNPEWDLALWTIILLLKMGLEC